MIFVFGSNLDGNHVGGAARFAYLNYGAKMGIAEGLTGNAYAIPTVGSNFESTHIEHVEEAVYRFIAFASVNPNLKFQVTRIGCGIAGWHDADIAPMFAGAPANCLFDSKWFNYLPTASFWGTI